MKGLAFAFSSRLTQRAAGQLDEPVALHCGYAGDRLLRLGGLLLDAARPGGAEYAECWTDSVRYLPAAASRLATAASRPRQQISGGGRPERE